MQRVVKRISDWLVENNSIQEEDRELYEYAIVSTCFNIAPLILAVTIGLIMHMCVEAVAMILPFMLLRKYAGGYHAKSPYVCLGCSIAVIIAICCYIRFFDGMFINAVIFIAAELFLLFTDPIESANKKLDEKEVEVYKQVMTKILLVLTGLILVCFIIDYDVIGRSMMAGIVLTAFLAIPCHLLKK